MVDKEPDPKSPEKMSQRSAEIPLSRAGQAAWSRRNVSGVSVRRAISSFRESGV